MRFPTTAASLALAASLLVLSGCSTELPPPRELIVGNWEAADGSGDTVEFTGNGVVRFKLQGATYSGKYTFPEENGIVLAITWDEGIRNEAMGLTAYELHQGVTIRNDELEVGGPDNRGQRKYRRSK